MKNKLLLVFSFLLLLTLTSGALIYFGSLKKADEQNVLGENISALAKAVGDGEIVVGIDEAYPPVTFKDSSGNYAGMDIDFIKEVEKRTGVKMIIKPIEWDNIIPSLLSGDIDIIWSGMTITDARAEKVDFIKYQEAPAWIALVKSTSPIQSRNDLSGKIIAVQAGSSQEDDLINGRIIPTGSWAEIKSPPTLPEAIIDLGIGRVDVVICDQDTAGYYIQKTLNQSSSYRIVNLNAEISSVGIAIRKNENEILVALKDVVNEIIQDGTASKFTISWLGVDKYKDWD